jgi:ribosomal-protein-alanine N-acetyltransferase
MSTKKAPLLEGKDIILRLIDPEKDYKQWYKVMKDPEMHKIWTGNTVPKNPEETKKMLQHYKEIDHIVAWSVILKSTQEIIGTYWLAVPITTGSRNNKKSLESLVHKGSKLFCICKQFANNPNYFLRHLFVSNKFFVFRVH